MLIDLIMDRKGGQDYDRHEFLKNVVSYGVSDDLIFSLELNKETETKIALSKYIVENNYNPELCGYIWSVNWAGIAGPDRLNSDWYRVKMQLCYFWYDRDPYEYSWPELFEMEFATDLETDLQGLEDLGKLEEDEQETDRLNLMALVRYLLNAR